METLITGKQDQSAFGKMSVQTAVRKFKNQKSAAADNMPTWLVQTAVVAPYMCWHSLQLNMAVWITHGHNHCPSHFPKNQTSISVRTIERSFYYNHHSNVIPKVILNRLQPTRGDYCLNSPIAKKTAFLARLRPMWKGSEYHTQVHTETNAFYLHFIISVCLWEWTLNAEVERRVQALGMEC